MDIFIAFFLQCVVILIVILFGIMVLKSYSKVLILLGKVRFVGENAEKYLSKKDLEICEKMFADFEGIVSGKYIFLVTGVRMIIQMEKIAKEFEQKIKIKMEEI